MALFEVKVLCIFVRRFPALCRRFLYDACIPVILADRSVKVEDEELYTCWVGSDFEKEGREAGEWLMNYLDRQGRSDEKIHLVTLQGTINSTTQLGRTAGFAEVLEAQDNWEMLEYRDVDFEYNPILAPLVKRIIEKLENGEPVEKIQYVEEQYFDTSMDLERIMEIRNY